MWIVRLALRRPYTFIVMGLVIVMLGVAAIRRTPTDIFPNIDIPVVSIVWTYGGLSTEEMEQHITTFSEFSTSFAVSNIRNIERRAEVPWLAKIPVAGFFFKQEGYNEESKSLMILIRAHITDVKDELTALESRIR